MIRLPNQWNGKLVVTGAPGVRKQYATDYLISDWVLARGYAFAATDKGNSGTNFYNDGVAPGDAIVEWNRRVTELTVAAKDVVRQHYGRVPDYTYMTGISNGGYLTRHAIENRPDLYDGAVDWEGVHWRRKGRTCSPSCRRRSRTSPRTAPAARPRTRRSSPPASRPARSSCGSTTGPSTGTCRSAPTARRWTPTTTARSPPACRSACRARRSATPTTTTRAGRRRCKDAVAKVALTGRIGKPMITLHGTLDSLLPIATNSDPYVDLVRSQGRGKLHRYYVVEGGNHVDQLYDVFPDRLRPIAPCYRQAFMLLEAVGGAPRGGGPHGRAAAARRPLQPASGDLAQRVLVEPAGADSSPTGARHRAAAPGRSARRGARRA